MRLRAQMAEGAELRLVLDARLRQDAVGLERHAVAETARREVAAGRDHAVAADRRRPLDQHVGVDGGVGADRDGVLDVGARRIEDRDAFGHQAVEDAVAQDRRDGRELLPVVDSERLDGVRHREGLDPTSGLREDPDDVRQVILALIVVGPDLGERRPQTPRVEAVDARVDLGDLLLVVGRIALFDDARDPPALTEDSPVPLRPVHDGRQHRRGRSRRLVVAHETPEGLARKQRHVTREHQRRAGAARRPRLQDGVARAEPLALLDERDRVARGRAHALGIRADDHDEPVGDHARRPEDVPDQGAATERVEHLGLPRAHPLGVAGGEDDGGQSVHLTHSIAGQGKRRAIKPARGIAWDFRRTRQGCCVNSDPRRLTRCCASETGAPRSFAAAAR